MAVDVEIRTIAEDEFEAYLTAVEAAFSATPAPEDFEQERALAEYDRCHAAFDGSEIVGTAAAFTMPFSIPGGELAVPFVTAVGVKATHRRRGINSALMRRQLEDVHERGEPVAVLYASEAGIYGRFGYGLASFGLTLDVETSRTAFVRGYRPSGSVRLVERQTAAGQILRVHEVVRRERPGMPGLNEARLAYGLHDHGPDRDKPMLFVLHEGQDGLDGYAIYRVKHDWEGSLPRSVLDVRDLQAASPGAYADLWRYVFDIDLVHRVKAWNRPVDEPLLHLVAEPRRLGATVMDGLWLRLVDVAEGLRRRRYAAEGRIVFEVRDRSCPWNEARYALEGGPGDAACSPSREEPDLVCTVNDVGAAYLGGTSFRQLHRAGRVEERSAGSLARADAMFAWDPAPWCPHVF